MLSLVEVRNAVLTLALLCAECFAGIAALALCKMIPIEIIDKLRALLSSAGLASAQEPAESRRDKAQRAGSAEKFRNLDAVGLIAANGFRAEEYAVVTKDGFILSLFRIVRPGAPTSFASESVEVNSRPRSHPVLLMHGFLECCEVWLCRSRSRSLAYILADAGFDVWLANVRGSKYGFKHNRLSSRSHEFWNFGIDEMASLDLPALVMFVLKQTRCAKLDYVAFSQGTAIGFAAFSSNVELADKIDLFVALAPTARVNALHLRAVNALVWTDPNLVYVLFGARVMMRWVIFWRTVLPPWLFVKALDASTWQLFAWNMTNIDDAEKAKVYPFLYSCGSVRNMVHWFQIMVTGRFQMYDDQCGGAFALRRLYRGHQPPQYSLRQMQVPVALFCGGADSLPDTKWLLSELSTTVFVHIEPSYEHLDFQFARCAPSRIYTKIVRLFESRT
mmetsp:Transcript_9235/g.24394  ORF Transcript_9235/g.24394 Transcript_9235/m.24394 type:complete len:447 (+) Transcript_9235:224-1564(+)